jgi:PPIC-type PPIASE domain
VGPVTSLAGGWGAWRARGTLLAASLALGGSAAGCVVTTYEGPSEPPRVAPAIIEPESSSPASSAEQAEEAEEKSEPLEIAAQHVLIQYRGAKGAAPYITRTKAQALARAKEVLKKARSGEDFAKLVKEYSDEPGAAARAGSVGHFTRGMMVKEFSDAAFKLKVGQISGIVETPFGFHVIKRTE